MVVLVVVVVVEEDVVVLVVVVVLAVVDVTGVVGGTLVGNLAVETVGVVVGCAVVAEPGMLPPSG